MKKIFSIILVVAYFGISVFAQGNETLLNTNNAKESNRLGSFGSSIFLGSPLDNNFGLGIGGGGGITINDFQIGIFGVGQIFQNSLVEVATETQQVDIGYGGLWLGYSFYNDYKLHPIVSLRSGLGALEVRNDNQDVTLMRESMIVLTPEVGLEFNITDNFRIASTVGYRWLSRFDERKLPKENYSGMTLNLVLRVVIE